MATDVDPGDGRRPYCSDKCSEFQENDPFESPSDIF